MPQRPTFESLAIRQFRHLRKSELTALLSRLLDVVWFHEALADRTAAHPTAGTAGGALYDLARLLEDHGLSYQPAPPIDFELALLRTIGGQPLSQAARNRLRQVYETPSDCSWHQAHAISITPLGRSLWQCVRDLDPSFPARRPRRTGTVARAPWSRIPTRSEIRDALLYAIAESPVLDRRDDPKLSTP